MEIKKIISIWSILVFSILAIGNRFATAEEPSHVEAMAAATEKFKINIKGTFASNCSWCHGKFGMKAGKGPQLAGTELTLEQTIERISNGKSGMMPPYLKVLGKEKVEALANYIKMLPGQK